MAKVLFVVLVVLIESIVGTKAETCIASVYTTKEGTSGSRTASGIRLNDDALTAAHKSKPFGYKLRVTNLKNGQEVFVKVTDRGPFIKGRCVDLTIAGARAIGCPTNGLCKVNVE